MRMNLIAGNAEQMTMTTLNFTEILPIQSKTQFVSETFRLGSFVGTSVDGTPR
jgi:hypothetical protein